jgi:hypothetical protein
MYTATSSFLWTAVLGVFVLRLVRRWCADVRGAMQVGADATTDWVSSAAVIVAWAYPLTTQGALLLTMYVPGGIPDLISPPALDWEDSIGCFVRYQYPAWRIVTLYGPLWASMLITAYCYITVACRLNSISKSGSGGEAEGDGNSDGNGDGNSDGGGGEGNGRGVKSKSTTSHTTSKRSSLVRIRSKMLLIPLVFILLRLPLTLQQVIELVVMGVHGNATETHQQGIDQSSLGVTLETIRATLDPSQGTFNCLIFVWTSPTYRRCLRQLLRRWCRSVARRCGCVRCCGRCPGLCCGCCGPDSGEWMGEEGGGEEENVPSYSLGSYSYGGQSNGYSNGGHSNGQYQNMSSSMASARASSSARTNYASVNHANNVNTPVHRSQGGGGGGGGGGDGSEGGGGGEGGGGRYEYGSMLDGSRDGGREGGGYDDGSLVFAEGAEGAEGIPPHSYDGTDGGGSGSGTHAGKGATQALLSQKEKEQQPYSPDRDVDLTDLLQPGLLAPHG